jgi:hypothetical protein
MLSDGPSNPDRVYLDKLGFWAFALTTGHRSARVSVNGSPVVVNHHYRRKASVHGPILVDPDTGGVPVSSYLTAEVRDRRGRPIDAKLDVRYMT